ncbi:MAG TPA: AraC family transcriptional regulator [Rhizomicrobium sp.]|nr:AraC family transcriptional regulator [Rhizomicrobium sp.]
MNADTLSDVLKAVRLKGAVFFDVETSAPWVAEALPAKMIASAILPDSEHIMEYHVLTRGSCWASMIGKEQDCVQLQAGDVVAFPHGDAHVMSSAPGMRGDPGPDMSDVTERGAPLPVLMNLDGGSSERAHLVCGFLGCDARPFNPLLESLPSILHIRASGSEHSSWLKEFTRFAVLEANEKRVGADGILSKLGELMFAELVRRYVESLPEDSRGWLGGLRDRSIGRALNLMHAEPSRGWTLNALAEEAGLSRSAFAERFAGYVGIPPMQYLQKWRLQIAASQLLAGGAGIASIAADVGYEPEAAFSRAFKRVIGQSPADWRNARTASR